MTAETIIEKNTRFDRSGSPVEVVIPYDVFIDFVETYGLDLSKEEKSALNEAKTNREAGGKRQCLSSEEIKEEFGIA